MRSFSLISSAKCVMASGVVADRCGHRSTAAHISSLVQLRPVRVGHPKVAAAGWFSALPVGHIELGYVPRALVRGVES